MASIWFLYRNWWWKQYCWNGQISALHISFTDNYSKKHILPVMIYIKLVEDYSNYVTRWNNEDSFCFVLFCFFYLSSRSTEPYRNETNKTKNISTPVLGNWERKEMFWPFLKRFWQQALETVGIKLVCFVNISFSVTQWHVFERGF